MLSDPKTGKAKLEDDVIGDLFAADGDDLLNISDHDLSSAALDAVLNSPVKNGTCHYKTADEKKPYKRVLTSVSFVIIFLNIFIIFCSMEKNKIVSRTNKLYLFVT